jgi:hypothetical protein
MMVMVRGARLSVTHGSSSVQFCVAMFSFAQQCSVLCCFRCRSCRRSRCCSPVVVVVAAFRVRRLMGDRYSGSE